MDLSREMSFSWRYLKYLSIWVSECIWLKICCFMKSWLLDKLFPKGFLSRSNSYKCRVGFSVKFARMFIIYTKSYLLLVSPKDKETEVSSFIRMFIFSFTKALVILLASHSITVIVSKYSQNLLPFVNS